MANIQDITEAWQGHSGLEVETFIKAMLNGKFGYAQMVGTNLVFYDKESGTPLSSINLGGQNYTVNIACNLSQTFYVLSNEVTKMMTITPTTTISTFGSSSSENYPESYTYTVEVNSGTGYGLKLSGNIATGGSATFDVRPYLANGDNYIRVSVTGTASGQVRTTVFTATLTSLAMNVNHAWQEVWNEGEGYTITGIRFQGSIAKRLHVSITYNGVTTELPYVDYGPNISYITTATYYTISSEYFPQMQSSGLCTINLWMTAQGVSTPTTSYNIMCAKTGSTSPLVCINAIAERAVNYTSGVIFGYAVYNANKASVSLAATLGSSTYLITQNPVEENDREAGVQYSFAYALEVDTGANETLLGSLSFAVVPYQGSTAGPQATASTIFDNTYSYIATPGYLFYLNAATRSNGAANRQVIVNEAGASANFPASYNAVWSGLSWFNDGWYTDKMGYKALCIPAGCSLSVTDLKPISSTLMNTYDGMTVEFMIQCANPSKYDLPVFSITDIVSEKTVGIRIYPTRVEVLGSAEQSVDYQSVNISENTMTHVCITWVKKYEGQNGKNLCSIYINGTSNISFEYAGDFGAGNLVIGQTDTDAYLYKMRVYGQALESRAVFNNFLNCIVDGLEFTRQNENARNNVLEGTTVDYDKVKAAGLNTMVVITPNNEPIPDYYNQVEISGCTVRFEYAGAATKNATMGNVTMDGQGTTSKKYYRWNLRWKTNDNTTWAYGDGTTGSNGKKGRIINDDSYIMVDRATAKKNVASSPQGHKMGMTGLYNDLFHHVGLGSELPDSSYRVAVYQFPFVGFQYNTSNNTYTYIGQYTAGPDKGSKVTFGYIKSQYPDCLSIEGPNHDPRGTRFLHPWVDVEYDPREETLNIGDNEAWDCDYVKYETGYGDNREEYPDDWAAIRQLYEDEWRPAYNCVYDNSPYLASYQEVINDLDDPNIKTLAHLLTAANASAVKGGVTNGMIVKNEFIAFYDSSYDLYFYRPHTGMYEKLPNAYTGYKNALTGLATYLTAIGASTSSPTTAQLIQARAARFKHDVGDYFSINQLLFHYDFCDIYGVTDNDAKNMYPFKFRRLTDSGAGNRWGFRQDDLDTVLATDNTGTNTKKYSVEHGDTADNVQIFQGGDSALWILIRDNFADERRTMMESIANAANSLATALGIQGSGLHQSLYNLTSYYCWEKSAKYFPQTLYESDRRWAYIEPWLMAGTVKPGGGSYPGTYNGVAPLAQALGDQFQSESLWVERRIAYIFSKYHIGAFHGTTAGYNEIVFTLARAFTFKIKPAIDLYPVTSLVQQDFLGGRTPAGTETQIPTDASGGSNNSIHGGDWLASLGDLCQMRLTSRGGSPDVEFNVNGARLQTLKIGDADAANLVDGFNATVFGVTSPTITEIDARNTATIQNIVNLLGCPRLRTCYFAGSGADGLYLPVGAKLTAVSFPSGASRVFMHSLPFLTAANLTLPNYVSISALYINNCPNLAPIDIAAAIVGTTGNTLAYVTIIWTGIVQMLSVTNVVALSNLAGKVVYEDGSVSNVAGKPDVEGTVQVTGGLYEADITALEVISQEDYGTGLKKALCGLFETNFYVIYDPNKIYIEFADSVVGSICATAFGDGYGTTREMAAAQTNWNNFKTAFDGHTEITSFNELRYFGFTGSCQYGFKDCSELVEVTLPDSWTSGYLQQWFLNCTKLRTLHLGGGSPKLQNGNMSDLRYINRIYIKDIPQLFNFFYGLTTADKTFATQADNYARLFIESTGEEITSIVVPSDVTTIPACVLGNMKSITSVTIHSLVTKIESFAFYGCSGLRDFTVPNTVTETESPAFYLCGDGTGTLRVGGTIKHTRLSFSSQIKYANIYLNDVSIIAASVIIGGGYCKTLRIAGNVTGTNSSGSVHGSYNNPQLLFLELMGTSTGKLFADSNGQDMASGCIVHLGYNGVALTPTNCKAQSTKLTKIYVGSGASQAADQAVLDQYLADSDWASYSSKLDLWYNYNGEYKNS